MKTIYINYSERVNALVTDAGMRSKFVALSVAFAAAAVCDLPSSPVENPTMHYSNTAQSRVRAILSDFNENVVFDVGSAIDYARQFWMLRYNAAHPFGIPLSTAEDGFFQSIVGAHFYMSPDLLKLLNEHGQCVLILAFSAREIIGQMNLPEVAFERPVPAGVVQGPSAPATNTQNSF